MSHDIIDNRREDLAVVNELRLFVGATTNRGALDQSAEGRDRATWEREMDEGGAARYGLKGKPGRE